MIHFFDKLDPLTGLGEGFWPKSEPRKAITLKQRGQFKRAAEALPPGFFSTPDGKLGYTPKKTRIFTLARTRRAGLYQSSDGYQAVWKGGLWSYSDHHLNREELPWPAPQEGQEYLEKRFKEAFLVKPLK